MNSPRKISCKTNMPAEKFFLSVWGLKYPQSAQFIICFYRFLINNRSKKSFFLLWNSRIMKPVMNFVT